MASDPDQTEWLRKTLTAERGRRAISLAWLAKAVARELDVPKFGRQSIQKWEAGKTTPAGLDEWRAWAAALGFRFDTDLVRQGDDRVAVLVRADVAPAARLLGMLQPESLEQMSAIVRRLVELEGKLSPGS